MNFKNTIREDLDKKYGEMLDGKSPSPYAKDPEMADFIEYARSNRNYHERLNKEKEDFNAAVRKIRRARADRESRERREARRIAEEQRKRAEDRKYRNFKIGKAIKTFAFLLPAIMCIIIGIDIFNSENEYSLILKYNDMMPFGWVIFFYVVACIISVLVAVIPNIQMRNNDDYSDSKDKTITASGVKSIIIFIVCGALIVTNLSIFIPHLFKSRVVYYGSYYRTIEYVDNGDSVILPERLSKFEELGDNSVVRYDVDSWQINGIFYEPGSEYTPEGWEDAYAMISTHKFYRVTVYGNDSNLSVIYSESPYFAETNGGKYYPYGTMVSITNNTGYTYVVSSNGVEKYIETGTAYDLYLENYAAIGRYNSGGGCLTEGSLITMADGSLKKVEDLEKGDMLLAFNHETGRLEPAPLLVNVHATQPAAEYKTVTLYFDDGSSLRIVDEHGLFDLGANKYVYVTAKNAKDFIGHEFAAAGFENGEAKISSKVLRSVEIKTETLKIYNPASVWHINLVADGSLTLSAGMVNLFEYGEGMAYDKESMQADIEKYGLYTYDDFRDYVSEEVFNAFPFAYYKVVVGKGEFSFEEIIGLIVYYDSEYSLK